MGGDPGRRRQAAQAGVHQPGVDPEQVPANRPGEAHVMTAAHRIDHGALEQARPEAREERRQVQGVYAAAFASNGWGWRKLKELILIAYYWSEIGATQELRYELAPGVWEAKVPIGPDTRAWAL